MNGLYDFLDPNTWQIDDWEHRVYADDYANVYAVVDQIDYQYLIQWRWKLKASRIWPGTKKPKVYLARSDSETLSSETKDENGRRVRYRLTSTIYLHQVVMERKGTPKPVTNKKIIVDHADGEGFNCRRENLRYATLSFNNKNINGSHQRIMVRIREC